MDDNKDKQMTAFNTTSSFIRNAYNTTAEATGNFNHIHAARGGLWTRIHASFAILIPSMLEGAIATIAADINSLLWRLRTGAPESELQKILNLCVIVGTATHILDQMVDPNNDNSVTDYVAMLAPLGIGAEAITSDVAKRIYQTVRAKIFSLSSSQEEASETI